MSVASASYQSSQQATGISNEKLGLILCMLADALLFFALFGYYLVNRLLSNGWPPEGFNHARVAAAPVPLLLTFILLISGWSCSHALASARRGSELGTLGWLSATVVLGTVFVVSQGAEFTRLILQDGLTPAGGIYASTFFALTGLHVVHVLGGVGLFVAMYCRGLAGHFADGPNFGLSWAATYWSLLIVVWLLLYGTVYLL